MQPRRVLLIPLDQVERQLASQSRQDLKVVVPAMLSAAQVVEWKAAGRDVSPEVELSGDRWQTSPDGTIAVCPSSRFEVPEGSSVTGPLAVSFALPGAPQVTHLHRNHWEMYFCSERLAVSYRLPEHHHATHDVLDSGGLALFGPGVLHEVRAQGLLVVVEFPSVLEDKAGD